MVANLNIDELPHAHRTGCQVKRHEYIDRSTDEDCSVFCNVAKPKKAVESPDATTFLQQISALYIIEQLNYLKSNM